MLRVALPPPLLGYRNPCSTFLAQCWEKHLALGLSPQQHSTRLTAPPPWKASPEPHFPDSPPTSPASCWTCLQICFPLSCVEVTQGILLSKNLSSLFFIHSLWGIFTPWLQIAIYVLNTLKSACISSNPYLSPELQAQKFSCLLDTPICMSLSTSTSSLLPTMPLFWSLCQWMAFPSANWN